MAYHPIVPGAAFVPSCSIRLTERTDKPIYMLRVTLYHGFYHVEVMRGRHSAHDMYSCFRTVKNLLVQVLVFLTKVNLLRVSTPVVNIARITLVKSKESGYSPSNTSKCLQSLPTSPLRSLPRTTFNAQHKSSQRTLTKFATRRTSRPIPSLSLFTLCNRVRAFSLLRTRREWLLHQRPRTGMHEQTVYTQSRSFQSTT